MKKSILFMKRAAAGLAVTALCATSAIADTAAVEAALADGLTDTQKFGAAALLIVVGIAVYKYMKRAV